MCQQHLAEQSKLGCFFQGVLTTITRKEYKQAKPSQNSLIEHIFKLVAIQPRISQADIKYLQLFQSLGKGFLDNVQSNGWSQC